MRNHPIRSILVALAMTFGAFGVVAAAAGVTPVEHAPTASATVGTPCQTSYYRDSVGITAAFIYCGVGMFGAFRTHISCGTGQWAEGPWQSSTGPWLGSYAHCPGSSHATVAFPIFSSF